jgi:hypothetical protein
MFERPRAHHQEPNNCNSSLWVYLRIMVIAGLLFVRGPVIYIYIYIYIYIWWKYKYIWSKMYIGLHAKYPLFWSHFNETWIFLTDFPKKKKSLSKNTQWSLQFPLQHCLKVWIYRGFASITERINLLPFGVLKFTEYIKQLVRNSISSALFMDHVHAARIPNTIKSSTKETNMRTYFVTIPMWLIARNRSVCIMID